MRIVAIDPGFTGAIAILTDPDPALGVRLDVHDMPVHEVTRNRKKRRALAIYEIARIIDDAFPVHAAAIELVNGREGESIAADCAFCRGAGVVLGICAANFIRTEEVTPTVWRRSVGIKPGAGKDAARKRACELFPAHASLFSRVKDHGRAEAALLAWHFAQRLKAERLGGATAA
jgi:crossover junction endodeoxyribonuclease RuvC